ncbi:MAG: hypothetical protein LBV16_06945 [Elusimicrobiota bacterium]|jgi:hypothetical protein|nr:hypothetical protein [Elusimicrobiota bacterium]
MGNAKKAVIETKRSGKTALIMREMAIRAAKEADHVMFRVKMAYVK